MLAHHPGACVVKNYELSRLVDPAVLKTQCVRCGGRERTVPQRAAEGNGRGGSVSVKGDEESRGVYCMQDRGVMLVCDQVGVILGTLFRGVRKSM